MKPREWILEWFAPYDGPNQLLAKSLDEPRGDGEIEAHVIEKSAYDAAIGRIAELETSVRILKDEVDSLNCHVDAQRFYPE